MLELGLQQQHLEHLRVEYAARCRALCDALRTHAPACRFSQPEGGYFVWVELPDGLTATTLHEHLRNSSAGIAVLPGGRCRVVEDKSDSHVRLCFAFYGTDELVTAAKRLGVAIAELSPRRAHRVDGVGAVGRDRLMRGGHDARGYHIAAVGHRVAHRSPTAESIWLAL